MSLVSQLPLALAQLLLSASEDGNPTEDSPPNSTPVEEDGIHHHVVCD